MWCRRGQPYAPSSREAAGRRGGRGPVQRTAGGRGRDRAPACRRGGDRVVERRICCTACSNGTPWYGRSWAGTVRDGEAARLSRAALDRLRAAVAGRHGGVRRLRDPVNLPNPLNPQGRQGCSAHCPVGRPPPCRGWVWPLERAEARGDRRVEGVDLLAGLVADRSCRAAEVLGNSGFDAAGSPLMLDVRGKRGDTPVAR